MPNQLDEARRIINEVDAQMAELFVKRMRAAELVYAYKKENGLPILDRKREDAVVERNAALVEDDVLKGYYMDFLKNTMAISRAYQYRMQNGLKVAYSGVEGAFAHIAAGRIFPEGNRMAYSDFKAAYDAVVSGECDAAVLPIENSYAGEVGQTMDLIFSGTLFINGIYELEIHQNLLGLPDATAEDIRKVTSHPQALSQCRGFIKKHGYEERSFENTALAAEYVAQHGDKKLAAIASEETAELYGLSVLAANINEAANNTTRFALLSRSENRSVSQLPGAHFVMMFTVRNEAGALANALNIIGDHGFNMRSLRSRPMKELLWQYYFYVEAEGDENSEAGQEMLAALKNYCDMLKVVGGYTMEVSLQKKRGDEE